MNPTSQRLYRGHTHDPGVRTGASNDIAAAAARHPRLKPSAPPLALERIQDMAVRRTALTTATTSAHEGLTKALKGLGLGSEFGWIELDMSSE